MKKRMIQCLMFPALLAMATNLMAQGTVEDYRRAYSAYGKFNASQVYDDPSSWKRRANRPRCSTWTWTHWPHCSHGRPRKT